MIVLPELWELEALFEAEAVDVFGEEKAIPWVYKTLNFKLTREAETLDITISPSYAVIDIWIFASDRKIAGFSLENIFGLKIEKKGDKEILHVLFDENNSIKSFHIVTNPRIEICCNTRSMVV